MCRKIAAVGVIVLRVSKPDPERQLAHFLLNVECGFKMMWLRLEKELSRYEHLQRTQIIPHCSPTLWLPTI